MPPFRDQTPEYAENPPSTGITVPVTKPEAAGSARNLRAPRSSVASPKRPIGVAARILPVLAVGVPSGLKRSALFWLVAKKPGAIPLTLIPSFAK